MGVIVVSCINVINNSTPYLVFPSYKTLCWNLCHHFNLHSQYSIFSAHSDLPSDRFPVLCRQHLHDIGLSILKSVWMWNFFNLFRPCRSLLLQRGYCKHILWKLSVGIFNSKIMSKIIYQEKMSTKLGDSRYLAI